MVKKINNKTKTFVEGSVLLICGNVRRNKQN